MAKRNAVSLHFMHYNFCRPHQTLSKQAGNPTRPMTARIERHPWSLTQLAELLEARRYAPVSDETALARRDTGARCM